MNICKKVLSNILLFSTLMFICSSNVYAESDRVCEDTYEINDYKPGGTSSMETVVEIYAEHELGLGGGAVAPDEKKATEVAVKPKGSVKCVNNCPEVTPPPPDPFRGDNLGIDANQFYEDCEDSYIAKYFNENGVNPTEEEIWNECEPKTNQKVKDALNNWGDKCYAVADFEYLDMKFEVDLGDGYDYWKVDNENGGLGLYAWDGETFNDPIYLKGKLEMISIVPLMGSNLSLTSAYPIKYAPLGYQDNYTFKNERYDYYIMNTDNPSATWENQSIYGKYVLIKRDKFGNDVEKTTNPDIKIDVSNAKNAQRGTLLSKRLRFADFTYTRSFEFSSSWRLYFEVPSGRMSTKYAYAIKDSWLTYPHKGSNIALQDLTAKVGQSITVGVFANTDGSISKNTCVFPNDFYAGNAGGIIGVQPNIMFYEAMCESYLDVLERKKEVDNATTYGETTRGKIAIGTYPFGSEMESLGFDYFPTGLNEEYLGATLKFGQWIWFEKQEGVLPNTFIVEVDMSTVSVSSSSPGTLTTRYICMGEYNCQCEDINVLCSCEDEEAGCNPALACENGEDCSGPPADNKGGCDPTKQPDCNEHGEPTTPKFTPDGIQIPAGGPGGVTGKGSTDYYEKHLEGSSTLLH